MTATVLNITVEQNADFDLDFPAFEADGTTPIDFAGCTARMQIRDFYQMQGGVILLEASTANGRISFSGNTIQVRILGKQTAQLTMGVIGKYDLLVYFPDGRTKRILQGSVSINRGVTLGAWESSH